jgi:hypothetical protein
MKWQNVILALLGSGLIGEASHAQGMQEAPAAVGDPVAVTPPLDRAKVPEESPIFDWGLGKGHDNNKGGGWQWHDAIPNPCLAEKPPTWCSTKKPPIK